MINISFSVSKIVPAVPKLQLLQHIDARLKVPYLPVYCALFCPYLHKDKATKRATAFGHWERLINKYLQTYINVRCTLHAQPWSLLQ